MRDNVEKFRKNENIEVSSKNLSAILKNLEKIKKKLRRVLKNLSAFYVHRYVI